ncbi:MAG: cytochrome P450 [Actinomycetota bacterium]
MHKRAEHPVSFVDQRGDFDELLSWFARMRDAHPVSYDQPFRSWHAFRYDDIERILADPTTYSSDLRAVIPSQEDFELFARGSFIGMDPPQHSKLRRLVTKAFTPRVVEQLAPRIAAITNELLDAPGGAPRFDLVAGLAYPLPVAVIAEMVGIPPGDRDDFRRWARAILDRGAPATAIPDEEMMESFGPTFREMNAYLLTHIRHRRANPTDDRTSSLIAAQVDGERLEDEEIVGFIALLMIAGHITTTTLLTNAVLCFDRHPEAATALRADRAGLPMAIEEILRYRPPFPWGTRLTTRETTLGDQTIPAGQVVNFWMASANRDERHFPDPDHFDIRRRPNRHLSFGHGIHACFGAPLARLEARIALDILLERCASLTVDEGVELFDPRVMIGAKQLPLKVEWG